MGHDRGEPIDRLRRLAARLHELGDDGVWLADRLALYLSDRASSLDAAFGLLPDQGQRSWRWIERRRRRDELIRRLADMLPQALPRRSHAQVIADALRRYEATAWIRDRRAGRPPARASEAAGLKFGILNLGDAPSLSTVRRALSEADQ